MLSNVQGQGARSVDTKRLWAEEAPRAFIHSTDVYVLSTVVNMMSKISLTQGAWSLVGAQEQILVVGSVPFMAGRETHFPTRRNSICKGQENRSQDILV